MKVPHLPIVIAASAAAILGYGAFSIYVMLYTVDASLQGDVVGTWKSFAVLAFGFWLGSSSGGKAKDEVTSDVRVTNPTGAPVPTTDGDAP